MSKPEKSAQKLKIKSWYSNRYQLVLVQRNILLVFALFSVVAMSFAMIFVKYITSSKSLEPYAVEIEEKSGIATLVDQSTTKNFTGDEIVKKYFINQFLQSFLAYDPRTYKLDIEKARLFSAPSVYNTYYNNVNVKNLGMDSRIEVKIKTMNFLNPSTVQLRILRTTYSKGVSPINKDEIVTLNFVFANLKLSMEERLVNPLGFQITNYSISEEIFNY